MKIAARVIGALVIAGGLGFLLYEVFRWAPCMSPLPSIGPEGVIQNDSLPPACFELMQRNEHIDVVSAFWLASLGVVAVGSVLSRTLHAVAATVLAIMAMPALNAGYFWLPWDSADLMPGFGTGSAVLVALAGVLLVLAPVKNARQVHEARTAGLAVPA